MHDTLRRSEENARASIAALMELRQRQDCARAQIMDGWNSVQDSWRALRLLRKLENWTPFPDSRQH